MVTLCLASSLVYPRPSPCHAQSWPAPESFHDTVENQVCHDFPPALFLVIIITALRPSGYSFFSLLSNHWPLEPLLPLGMFGDVRSSCDLPDPNSLARPCLWEVVVCIVLVTTDGMLRSQKGKHRRYRAMLEIGGLARMLELSKTIPRGPCCLHSPRNNRNYAMPIYRYNGQGKRLDKSTKEGELLDTIA